MQVGLVKALIDQKMVDAELWCFPKGRRTGMAAVDISGVAVAIVAGFLLVIFALKILPTLALASADASANTSVVATGVAGLVSLVPLVAVFAVVVLGAVLLFRMAQTK